MFFDSVHFTGTKILLYPYSTFTDASLSLLPFVQLPSVLGVGHALFLSFLPVMEMATCVKLKKPKIAQLVYFRKVTR